MKNEVIHQWNNAAEKYVAIQKNSEYANINKNIVEKRFSKFNDEIVLDLGCGYGYYTDYFRRIGAYSIGVDGAKRMIEIAKDTFIESNFILADLLKPLPYEESMFDIVFCNQVLMDIESIEKVFTETYRVLKAGGIFYFSIVHPAFYEGKWQTDESGFEYAKTVFSYLTPHKSQNDFWGKTAHFHRPISYYLNAASDAGFVLKHIDEPRIYNGINRNEDLPLFFFAEYEKN